MSSSAKFTNLFRAGGKQSLDVVDSPCLCVLDIAGAAAAREFIKACSRAGATHKQTDKQTNGQVKNARCSDDTQQRQDTILDSDLTFFVCNKRLLLYS